jgi:hypothetical protein
VKWALGCRRWQEKGRGSAGWRTTAAYCGGSPHSKWVTRRCDEQRSPASTAPSCRPGHRGSHRELSRDVASPPSFPKCRLAIRERSDFSGEVRVGLPTFRERSQQGYRHSGNGSLAGVSAGGSSGRDWAAVLQGVAGQILRPRGCASARATSAAARAEPARHPDRTSR